MNSRAIESFERICGQVVTDWRADKQEVIDLQATVDDLCAKLDQERRVKDAMNVAMRDRDDHIKRLEATLRAQDIAHKNEVKQLLAENAQQAAMLNSIAVNIQRAPDSQGMLAAMRARSDAERPLALQNRENH